VLAARVRDYHPADLDALFTAGDLLWVGDGALGSDDGRIRFAFRDQASLLLPRPPPASDGAEPAGPSAATSVDAAAAALLEHLTERGASFWSDLVGALAGRALPYDDASTLAALWDLVWAGLVTNDSLAPLRAYLRGARSGAAGGASRAGSGRGGRSIVRARPRPGRLSRIGPPAGAGRWSLVAPQLMPAPPPTELATARAFQLLERYGVLTRETALAEGIEGGFAGVYPVLKALEERGQVRRGYFVAGLGAAQFALPGAVDRLRASRAGHGEGTRGLPPGERSDDAWRPDGLDDEEASLDGDDLLILSAVDPAQPYGAALPWPTTAGRPARAAGAHVVLAGGEAVAFLERSGRSLLTFPAAAGRPGWASTFRTILERRSLRQIEIARIDGGEPGASPGVMAELHAAGFAPGYRGPILRR
jgi:ATP-dependent Lhr-like helicase